MNLPLALLLAYMAGALPASALAARLAGVDLRSRGSRNLGATNVYRVLGWKYAVPVGLLDIAKGAIPVIVLPRFVGENQWIPVSVGVSAILGHVFSIFVRFRGGKGVATAAGVFAALAPVPLLISVAVWLTVVTATGYVSLASMLAALAFPVSLALLPHPNHAVLIAGIALAGLILITHRTNIKRLLSGRESRFGHRGKEVTR